jgi:FtsP/CotA-like multicopper oxidase with cupredoxin domain
MKMELLASKAYRKCTSGNVTIEFYGSEYGDWFFHCHILYHMMGGMARVFSYDTPRAYERVSRF